MRTHRLSRLVAAVALLLAALASRPADAAAQLDAELLRRLATALPLQQLEVVVTYRQATPVSAAQVQVLRSLGITRGLRFQALPIAGALATPGAISRLAARPEVLSIHANRNLG